MRRLALPALACLLAIPSRAATPVSSRITFSARQAPKADNRVRAWLEEQPQLRKNLAAAVERADSYRPVPDPDLRDSISDLSTGLRERIESSQGADRRALLANLPGLKASDLPGCSTLDDCPQPLLALDVEDSAQLRPAIRSLVRPWLLLAQARRSAVSLEAATQGSDRALALSLPGLSLRDVGVNVAARPEGGFHVWMDQALVLASIFAQERESLLARR
jgi:hypothetical protein